MISSIGGMHVLRMAYLKILLFLTERRVLLEVMFYLRIL